MYQSVCLDQLPLTYSDELVRWDSECEVQVDQAVMDCYGCALDDDREAQVRLLVEIAVDLLRLVAATVRDEAVVLRESHRQIVRQAEVQDLVAIPIPVHIDTTP